MLKEAKIPKVAVDEKGLSALLETADPNFRAILLTAFDAGMGLEDLLELKRSWLDLRLRRLALPAAHAKGKKAQTVHLTARTVAALKALPVVEGTPYVFSNPETWTRRRNTSRMGKRAKARTGRSEASFHDLRGSIASNARRRGSRELVITMMLVQPNRSIFDRYNIVEERDVKEAARLYEQGAERELASLSETPGASPVSVPAAPATAQDQGVDKKHPGGVDE